IPEFSGLPTTAMTRSCQSRRGRSALSQGDEGVSVYKAEYIWIDGAVPTPKLRSKTKIVPKGQEPPIWGFDGSSTNQATGHASDCVLKPVFECPDPVRGGDDKLIMCEVLLTDMKPHSSNTRAP